MIVFFFRYVPASLLKGLYIHWLVGWLSCQFICPSVFFLIQSKGLWIHPCTSIWRLVGWLLGWLVGQGVGWLYPWSVCPSVRPSDRPKYIGMFVLMCHRISIGRSVHPLVVWLVSPLVHLSIRSSKVHWYVFDMSSHLYWKVGPSVSGLVLWSICPSVHP